MLGIGLLLTGAIGYCAYGWEHKKKKDLMDRHKEWQRMEQEYIPSSEHECCRHSAPLFRRSIQEHDIHHLSGYSGERKAYRLRREDVSSRPVRQSPYVGHDDSMLGGIAGAAIGAAIGTMAADYLEDSLKGEENNCSTGGEYSGGGASGGWTEDGSGDDWNSSDEGSWRDSWSDSGSSDSDSSWDSDYSSDCSGSDW